MGTRAQAHEILRPVSQQWADEPTATAKILIVWHEKSREFEGKKEKGHVQSRASSIVLGLVITLFP